jgi:amino acid adenylation domain-containing protein
LNNVYLALKADNEYTPRRLKISYKDFIIREMYEKTKVENIEFWRKELDGYKRVSFPAVGKDGSSKITDFHDFLPPVFMTSDERLQNAVKRCNTSLKHLCFAAYVYTLSMLSYENDVVMGLISNSRPEVEDGDKLIGCFLNTLPFRISIPAESTWENYVRMVDKKLLQLKKYEKVTFFEIVKIIGEGNRAGNAVFDTIFNYIDFHIFKQVVEVDEQIEDRDVLIQGYERTNTLFDLSVRPFSRGIKVTVRYSTSIVSDGFVKKLYGYFEKILTMIVACPEAVMRKDDILSNEEKKELLFEFNRKNCEYPQDKTIVHLFEEQVERTPDRIAAAGKGLLWENFDIQISYFELNERVNRVADYLKGKGAGVNTIVGIMESRSIEMIVGILGILRCGGAYLPIDPGYPQERIEYMLNDSASKILLTSDLVVECNQYLERTQLGYCAQPYHLAYIIYTSGTTGRPKGAMIEHRNVVRLLFNDEFQFEFNPREVWTIFHSFCFDFSVWEMYGALLYGGKAVIVPRTLARDSLKFLELLKREKVTVLNQTPSAFYNLIDMELLETRNGPTELSIRYIIFGGEALTVSRLKEWRERYSEGKLINMYGITETTVHATFKEITDCEIEAGVSNVGKPIPTLKVYILDKYKQLLPVGVAGEMYVEGEGVARGYLNRPTLTFDTFVYFSPEKRVETSGVAVSNSISSDGGILYKSGDRARYLTHGDIEYLGRIDSQVKIRGFRIELGEIENRLLLHKGVKESIVIIRKGAGSNDSSADTDYYLCAYIVPVHDGSATAQELREYLLLKLPEYMIPSYFVFLESMPLTPNGKINKNALPEPVLEVGKDYEAPRDEMEEILVEIWSDVLAVEKEKIGINDSFFDMGGHSINAIALMSKIYKNFDVKIPIGEIFKAPTIKGVSLYLKDAAKGKYSDIEEVEKKEYYPMSSQQKGLYFIQKLDPENISYNMSMVLSLKGDIQRDKLEGVLRRLIHRHEGLRTSFEIINDQPIQRIHRDVLFKVVYSEMTEEEAGMEVRSFKKPFDLNMAPLMRAKLIRLSNGKHFLLFGLHHIIIDAFSSNILMSDFMKLFSTEDNELTPLKLQYSDYSEWHHRLSRSGELDKQESYWLSRFSGELPLLKMATDFPRPAEKILEGNRVRLKLDKEQTNMLRSYIRKSETTLYIFILSVYTVLLSKYSGQDDIVVGSPISGRNHPDLYNILGLFANMLPMRNFPTENICYRDFLRNVKSNAISAFENQDYQFTELVSKLNVSKDISRHPLFDVVLALNNTGTENIENKGFTFESYNYEFSGLKFDLLLDILEGKDSVHFDLNYSVSLFKPATAEKILQHLLEILIQVCEDDGIMLKDIKISHDLVSVESVFPMEVSDIFEF